MADEIRDAKGGLVTRLETIVGLRVIDYEPDGWSGDFPLAIVRFTGRDAAQAMGGSSFEGQITVTLLVNKQGRRESFDELDKYVAPLGALSVEAAIDGDNTWNGKVDFGKLVSVENVGMRELWSTAYAAVDFRCQFITQVLT